MNTLHLERCASPEWRATLRDLIVPYALGDARLGDDVLEVGPGSGLTTDLLRERLVRLTAVEIDVDLATALADRLAGTNVDVINADATDLPFDDGRFSGAVSFTMLHHVPTEELQDRLFAEVARVLRPGALFVASDGVAGPEFAGVSGLARAWAPMSAAPATSDPGYLTSNENFITAIGRLAPGVTLAQAEAELAILGPRIHDEIPNEAETPDDRFSAAR
jgi:SAM-dependent methyltransferase